MVEQTLTSQASSLRGDKRGRPARPDFLLVAQQTSAASPGKRCFWAALPGAATCRQADRLGGNAGGGLGGEGAWGRRAAGPQGRGLPCTPPPALQGLASFPSTLRAQLFPLLLQQEGGVAGGGEGSLAGQPAPRQLPSGATVPERRLVSSCSSEETDEQGPCPRPFSELRPGAAAALVWSAPRWRAADIQPEPGSQTFHQEAAA